MGARDASFARCNCDWPDDERCKALPDDQTRWFNHLLWLQAVRSRSSVLLTSEYGVDYWSRKMALPPERIMEMIKSMAQQGLIGWTQSDDLVVVGVDKNHEKLGFKTRQPQTVINPFRVVSKWGIVPVSGQKTEVSGHLSGYEQIPGQMSDSRVEESRVEESTAATARARAEAAAAASPPSEGVEAFEGVPAAEVIRAWNVVAVRRDWPRCSKVPDGKSGEVFRACLKDPFFARNYRAALDILAEVRWNKQPFRITTFMKPDAVRALIDGEWSNPTGLHNGVYTGGQDLGF